MAQFSPDGKRILTASDDKSIKIWLVHLETSESIEHFDPGHRQVVNHVCISPDDKYLASASNDKLIKIWVLETG